MQDALSTLVAFPYGQMGAVMPIAVALALFANINMAFGRAAPAPASRDGALRLPALYYLSTLAGCVVHDVRLGG